MCGIWHTRCKSGLICSERGSPTKWEENSSKLRPQHSAFLIIRSLDYLSSWPLVHSGSHPSVPATVQLKFPGPLESPLLSQDGTKKKWSVGVFPSDTNNIDDEKINMLEPTKTIVSSFSFCALSTSFFVSIIVADICR